MAVMRASRKIVKWQISENLPKPEHKSLVDRDIGWRARFGPRTHELLDAARIERSGRSALNPGKMNCRGTFDPKGNWRLYA